MKLLTIFVLLFGALAQAHGAPAKSWECEGKDFYYNEDVKFTIEFADYDSNYGGYTSRMVYFDDENEKPLDLLKKTDCSSPNSPTYHPNTTLQFETSTKVSLTAACEAEVIHMIEATCTEKAP